MGIKRNFGYNLVLTFCNYLFPLLVYPYVSRVLQVENIGVCNFIDSIINYFVLFSMAGISSYGVREIARIRHESNKLSNVFSSLVVLNIILTTIALFLLIVCIYTVPQFAPYKEFLWIGAFKLVFGIFLVEWFVQGMELFKYITIRSVIIRFIYIICVFIFVKDKFDVVIYFALLSGTTVVNALVNWQYISRFVKFSTTDLTIRPLLKPVLSFGYYRILTSLYTTFNIVFLGFIASDTEVGYFSTASKLNNILMQVFTAFTTVMIPRVADMIKQNELQHLQSISNQVIRMLLTLSLPLSIFCFVFASQIVDIIAGPGYEGAIIPFKIIIGLITVIGLEQILVQQFLMASPKSNKYIVYISTIGAIVGLSLNFILTPIYQCIGTSISWVASEISILIISFIFVNKLLAIRIELRNQFDVLLTSCLYLIPFILINSYIKNVWVSILLGCGSGLVLFIFINFVLISRSKFPINIQSFIKRNNV